MTAVKRLKTALDSTGLPVCRMVYRASDWVPLPDSYIVIQITGAEPFYGDDDIEYLKYTFQVTIVSRDDYSDTIADVLNALRAADIAVNSIGAEYADAELEYFYIPIMVVDTEEI